MRTRLLLTLLCSASLAVPLSALDLDELAGRASETVQKQAATYDLPPELVEQARTLASSLGLTRANLTNYANEGLKALGDGQYVAALDYLDRIGTAKLSPGQRSAFEDLKVLADRYVLSRNFDTGRGGASGPLGNALEALHSKDYASAAEQLQEMIAQVEPTGDQLEILTSLRDQYRAWNNEKS